MPLHDWTRVPDSVFHTLHLGWLWNLAGALNAKVLPEGYVARPEEYVGPYRSDVLTLETGEVVPPRATPPASLQPTLTIAPPRFVPRKERRVTVFSARDERRVAVIELVSPGNKDSSLRAEWFHRKLLDYLEAGLQLAVVDVFPPTAVVKDGFAAAVARALGATEALAQKGRQAASFECRTEPPQVLVYVSEFAVGAPLPSAPLFLEPANHVLLPLEDTYAETVVRLPAKDRQVLGAWPETPRA